MPKIDLSRRNVPAENSYKLNEGWKEARDGNECAIFAGGNYAIPSARELAAAKMRRDLSLQDILSLSAYLHAELNLDQTRQRLRLREIRRKRYIVLFVHCISTLHALSCAFVMKT